MKTLKATTARIFLLCLIFIEQNVAEPARHNIASHHQDTARRHHAPSGIQAPHKLAPSSSKIYCISADSNIYEILHKANAYCRGNDFKCTFYHYSDHKYHNLGTIDVDRELFDKLLAKYENWLMTSEPIDENNGKDSNHKVRLKGSGNTLYSTYIIDEKTPDKASKNIYDHNVMQDTTKLDKHYRRHKAKLTGDQKTRYINGERVSVDPKFNKQQKYYEVFLPKDKHRGDPRTIYVDIDGDKENTDKEFNKDLNDKPMKVELNEYSSNEEGKFAVHDKHNRKDVYRPHSNNKIARTEDIEEINNYRSQVAINTKLGDNNKMLSDFNDTDENSEDDDDKLHRIHLVETNKHHNDLSADNFTYKRTNTVQLNEPVFHVENPRNRNNMHIFSLPDYTGHHSDIISDYTGYKDIHLLPNLPDDEEVPSLPSNYDISLTDATEKESPITLYANPNLQRVDDNLLPGHINYFAPKVTHGTPFSSQSGSSPIVSSSSETAAIPKYSPFDIALRSSPYSGVSETLTPCEFNTLSQGTISSSPSTVLSDEEKYKIDLLSSPFETTKSFADSNLFQKLSPVNPETTYFSQPLDVTGPVDATSFLNNIPKSFESVASYPSTATMPSPLNSKLGPEICQFPQMPYSSPYSQFSPSNMNLALLYQLQQNNNFAKPMFNQNSMFSQPSRNIFDIKINPFMTRPPFSYSYAEPFNPMPSYLSTPGSVINSSPSAYTNSILNGNRIPGTVSNSFLPLSPANQMSPLSLRQERPNYFSPPCPNPASINPYNNVSPLNLENYQIANNLAMNANLKVQDSVSPIQNTPLSVLDHSYRTTPSNYIKPTEANIFSSSAPNQAEPMTFNALENQFIQSQGETSSYSELAHITEKPCLNLQNEPLVTFDASLLGDHLFELSPTKPVVSNTDVNISDGSIDSEVNKLTPIDYSLVDYNSDTIHVQLNTTVTLNQEPQPKDEFNLSEDSNSILDSSLTDLDVDTSSCTAVDYNKPSINVTATINIESEQTQNNDAKISEFDSSLIGTDLPIPSEDSIVTEFDNENLTEDSSLPAFIPLDQSNKNVERELNQTVNIKQESNQTGIEYSDIGESILPPNLTEQGFKEEINIADLQTLDSTLIDLESDNITETVAQEFETVDGLPNVNLTVCEPDVNLSVQTNIDLKPEAENPQLLENPTGSTIDITINTSVNITDNNLNVLEPELVENKPNEKSIITNEKTEFIPLDETIHTKDKETINEFEAGEFIPAFTSGMNIPAEDITAEILPNNELNSSLVGPNLYELTEEPGIASTELDFTADLIGPTIFDINETLTDVPSKAVELSSLIKPISERPTIPPCMEPLEVSGQSDIQNVLQSGAIKESDILLSSNPLTFENSLIGPSLLNDTTRLETQAAEEFQEILPTSESPTINFESELLGPNLLPHKDSFENIESSLVGPGLDQVINAPEVISNSEVKLNFSSNLIGPNLIMDANEPDLLRKLEVGSKLDDGKPGPTIINGKPLVEDSVPYSEYQLDASLIGPHLKNNIIAKTNEVKPGLDQTNSVILDSSLIDNLFDSEKSINGPNGPSIVSSANILSSDLKREGIPLEADISIICPNPPVKPKYEELPSLPPFVPKISFTHDLIGPGLSKLHPETSLPNPFITQESTPIVSNGFLEELKPTTYSKLPDLYLPATPFKNAPQHSLPCKNLFVPSPLPNSLLNKGFPASVFNLPSNMLSQYQSPLYANSIPYSPLSISSKYSPLHNLPHTPISSPYLKPEYLQTVNNPLVLNALLNNPHLKDSISYYSPVQPPEPRELIGLPRLPNLQNLPNQYLQALNGIPFNMQPLKSNIPCAPQIKTPLSSTEINWQELGSLPVEVQNTPAKPAFKPVKSQTPIPSTFSPLKESHSLYDLNQNYHMIESELNKFIQEAKHDNKLGNYETFEEPSVPPCEKVKYIPGDNVEKYIPEATALVEPLNVAKDKLNLKGTEFTKVESESHFIDALDTPRNLPPKYKPKVKEQVCYRPLNEADILNDYQLLESPINTPIIKPSVSQKNIPKLPSTDQFYPYEILPEPLALPVKPSSSPLSFAKAQTSPLLSPPCLQEYTSVPASEYLPTSNLRPMPTPVSSRPSKTYGSPYLPEYPSPSYIDTYNMPIESPKPAVPSKPSQLSASPYLPTYSNAPLFETGIPEESPNLPTSAMSRELPILPAPLKPLSSTPLSPAEIMSPSYYSPTSTTYTDSPFINPASILTKPLSSPSSTSGLPCFKPLPENNPIFRELMQNKQLMKAMNIQPMANNIFPWNNANRKPNPFMLQTPNYLPYEPQTPNYLPYEPTLINMENFKKNKLFNTAIESNLQKLKDANTELWTTYDETYSNDSGTKIHENVVPESHLETVPYSLDSEKYTNLGVNKDLTTVPLETLSYATEFSKPKPVTQSVPIKMDISKKNELTATTLELNSQKLETAPSKAWTNYNEKSNNIYTNDSGTKIHEDIVPESHLETVPYTLESKENIKVHEAPISNYATESKLNHGRPVSYSQIKEAEYYKPIEKVPQASDMQWLPLSSAEYSPNSSPGLSKPCPKLSPFISSLNQSPYLQALPHFPSFLPTTLKGSPCKSKLDSLPYSSSPYYPATVEEYSELPTTAPFRNHTPLLPMNTNVLENIVSVEGTPYSPSAVSSPYNRLLLPASYLPSQYQSNMTPLPGLQLSPPTAEQLRYVSPITEGLSPIECTPVQSPINALPSKSMTPIPCPSPTSTLPIQNLPLLQEPAISYESYSPQPGLKYPPKYQNIIEHLPTPVPLKESPVYYEPASSPRLVKSPNDIESLPYTMSPSSEDIIRPASNNLSPINYASYTSPIEEYLEASPSLPCRPLMKPISPPPKPQLSVDEYTILPSSSEATPSETYSSYETKPYVPDISKPYPKSKPDLAKYLPVDTSPYQINDQPYMPVNKVQTPSNVEYFSESSPLLKQLLTPSFKGYNSLPFRSNVKLPYLHPTYMPLDIINTLPPALINPFIKSELKDILTPLSVPTNEIISIPKESNTISPISSTLDNYEEYIEPCPSPKLLQSSSLIKPLITPIKASPELLKEIPIEHENVISSSANIPQYISPNNSLLKQLIGNAYNSPLFLPQNNKQIPSEIDDAKLSTYEPIICNIDETSSPIAPIVSDLPVIRPCDLKTPLFNQYQSLSTENISPITMTPLSTTTSPLLTSSYQEICPTELAKTLPYTSNVRPTSSSVYNPPHRPSKLYPINLKYGPKSIVEYLPDTNNICPSEIPSYMEPAMVEATPYALKPKNIKQIQLDGFPIAELFAKAPKILPYNPLSKIEIPKTSEHQNIVKDSSDWVLINNENLADDKTDAKLIPCEYTETTENPAEAEYLKLAKLLETKPPKTEFEKYAENQYKEIPLNLLDDNVCKDVYKSQNIALNFPQKPQNSATFDNFYANNHIGASPLICLIDPRRESKNIKPIIDAKLPYNEISPDITYLDEKPSSNIELATDSDYNFITPSENLRSIPVSLTEGNPISLDPKYLDKSTSKSPEIIYGPNPVEYLPETRYYYPPKDNIDDIKYSGYKTYQLPTQKISEKSSNIPAETYYATVPISPPKSSIPYSYMSTISPETYIPEYKTLESPAQAKSDLRVQPQSPIYNNYYPINEVTVKPDNFDSNDEIKNCIINYINSKGLKDKLYTNNEELTIPIGNIAITKKEPHRAKLLPTSNPSIGLKVWQSNVKLIKAELKFKTNEVSVNNFMPILNNLNEYDIQEIRKIIKKYIDDKYGNHIEVNEPYTVDNQYTVIQGLNRNENDKYNLLWPTYYV